MIKRILIFLLCLPGILEAQQIDMLLGAGGLLYDTGVDVAADRDGNIYATGFFSYKCTFDTLTILANQGFDCYLVKYYPNGSIAWTRQWGGTIDDYPRALCLDGMGNVYVGSAVAYNCNIGDSLLLSDGDDDALLIKYSNDGELLWHRTFGGPGLSNFRDLQVVGEHLYATAYMRDTVVFGQDTFQTNFLGDFCLIKMDTSGSVIWSRKIGSPGHDRLNEMILDEQENIYLCGIIGANATFGQLQTSITGNADAFIAKYDSAGNPLWVKNFGEGYINVGGDIALDPWGNIYFLGVLTGPNNLNGQWFSAPNGALLKFNPSGAMQWHYVFNSTHDIAMTSVLADGHGNVYVGGVFRDSTVLGADTLITEKWQYTGLFMRFDSNGNLKWYERQTEPGSCRPSDLYFGQDSLLYVTGVYSGTIGLGGTVLNPFGSNDIFIARMRPDQTVEQVPKVSDPAFSIYPNPGTGLFYLDSPRPFKPVEYRVHDGCGRLVRQGRIDPANPSVDLQGRPPGLYFLSLESGDVRSSTKLILRHP